MVIGERRTLADYFGMWRCDARISSFEDDMAADQRIAYPTIDFIAGEGRVLALALEAGRFDLPSQVRIEDAQIGVGPGRDRNRADAEDARRFGSHFRNRLRKRNA